MMKLTKRQIENIKKAWFKATASNGKATVGLSNVLVSEFRQYNENHCTVEMLIWQYSVAKGIESLVDRKFAQSEQEAVRAIAAL